MALEILTGYAQWYFQTGQVQNSVRLAALVSLQPALNSQVRKTRVNPLLAELEQMLPPDKLAAALVQARTLDLNTVIEELLAGAGCTLGGSTNW